MYGKIQETAQFLKERMTAKPETAIILGSGLGRLTEEIEIENQISYADIPNIIAVSGFAVILSFKN